MKKRLILAAIVGFASFTAAQQNPDFSKMEVNILPVQGQVHMLVGAGGNVAVQAGDEGVLLVRQRNVATVLGSHPWILGLLQVGVNN